MQGEVYNLYGKKSNILDANDIFIMKQHVYKTLQSYPVDTENN